MIVNTDKFQLLTSGYKFEYVWVEVGKQRIWEND